MKLYVWVDPYPVSYGSSLVVAVASSLEEAKAIAAKSPLYKYGQFEESGPGHVVTLGEPHRIVDLPCAEWHEWAE